jgi:hypothetical protein
MPAHEERCNRLHHIVLVHELDVVVDRSGVGGEGLPGPQAHEIVVDVGAEHHAGPDDRHRAVRISGRPELADAIRLGLVARVRQGRHAPNGVVFVSGTGLSGNAP